MFGVLVSKKTKKYLFLLGGLFLFTVFLETQKPRPIDWSWSFSGDSKKPLGSYVLFDNMNVLFPSDSVKMTQRPIYNTLDKKNGLSGQWNYLFFCRSFVPDEMDTRKLLDFVAEGNEIFIAANIFAGKFAEALDIGTRGGAVWSIQELEDSAKEEKDSVAIYLTDPRTGEEKAYYYTRGMPRYYFTNTAGNDSRILGRDNRKNPNFLMIPYEKGRVFLSTLPQAFTNYYIAHPDNHAYAFRALSFLPVRPTFWDEYYKPERSATGGPLQFVLGQDPLKTAFLLFLLLVGALLTFGAKREQRAIPVLQPLQNTSLGFVKAVAGIYYRQKNHYAIAQKRIRFFFEHIREVYQVDPETRSPDWDTRLAGRSGLPKEKIREVFAVIDSLRTAEKVSEKELVRLEGTLSEFREKSLR